MKSQTKRRSLGKMILILALLAGLFLSFQTAQAGFGPILFQPYVTYSVVTPHAVGVGDFNHDGLNDVAVSNYTGIGLDGALQIFLQNEAGNLDSPATYSAGTRAESLAVGDLNNDGWDDVVVTNFNSNTISVFLQQADGTMAARVTYSAGSGPDAVAVGDVNGDGLDDVAVANWNSAFVSIFIQNATGTLNTKVDYASPMGGYDDIAIGDVNGDSLNDVIKMNGQLLNADLHVFTQSGTGTLNSAVFYNLPDNNIGNGIGVGDVTGDGKIDVVISYGGNTPYAFIAVFAQGENGTLLTPASYSAYDIPEAVEVSDLNDDGRSDIVVAHGGWNKVSVYLQQNNGLLGDFSLYGLPPNSASHYKPQGLAVGDINADTWPDILVANYNFGLNVLAHTPPDLVPPRMVSVTRVNTSPTNSTSVNFTVNFSEPVTGLDFSDFSLTQSGLSGATLSSISGSGAIYNVMVSTGTGNGTLRLDIPDTASITDLAGNPLDDLPYTSGQIYEITKTAPILYTPSDTATLNYNRPAFDWSNFPDARGYQIQVSKSAVFGTTLINVSLTGATNSQYTPTKDLPANTLLYWRVRAKLSATKYSAWSSIFTFTTGNPPSIPSLVLPTNGALLTNLMPTLDWSDSTIPAGTTFSHYQVQLDDNADFSSTLVDTNISVSTLAVGPLNTNMQYYWRVRAWNTNGDYSAWSVVRNFREAILAPILLSPIGGTTVGSLKPLFDWGDVIGATGYTIQVSLSSTFNTFAINVNINSPTSQYTHGTNLQAHRVYYWRVRANGPNGPSVWSVVATFSTP